MAIVPYDEPKKLMVRRKHNIVVKELTSLFTTIPHKGKSMVTLSTRIQELRGENSRLESWFLGTK